MEKVELHPETRWNWTCPICENVYEAYEEDEPEVFCPDCEEIFEPEYQG